MHKSTLSSLKSTMGAREICRKIQLASAALVIFARLNPRDDYLAGN
jgi:hypothetical protein